VTRRLAIGLLLAIVVLTGGVGVGWRLAHPTPSGLQRTKQALLDDRRFANGPTAGMTLAGASKWLLDDGTACQRRRGDDDPRCRVRLSAAAYTGVAAFVVAECTAPGVYRARSSLLSYVRGIESFDERPLGTVVAPTLPAVPTCEGP
jgi:hypothetical protein